MKAPLFLIFYSTFFVELFIYFFQRRDQQHSRSVLQNFAC